MSISAPDIPATARLKLIGDALVANWRTLNRLSGEASAGAAVKANAYGLGALPVVQKLLDAGCQDFFVANWQEAREIEALAAGKASISVLNGVREEDMAFAVKSSAKPALNSIQQAQRWSPTSRPCDVMINSGMNRLGINPGDLGHGCIANLDIDLAMSHLASADEDCTQNADQLAKYLSALTDLQYKRSSFANSAGIMLGTDYHFDVTRPGLSLYGGKPRPELVHQIQQVVTPQAQILQVRHVRPGDKIGYNATYIADHDHPVAILAMGYADGYLRGFSNKGCFLADGAKLPVIGRISMDLIAIDLSQAPQLEEGDWVDCEYDLPVASRISGLSQYELITGLGQRLPRIWQ